MLNQVRYFQAVVRCGSFTEAAEECHISQSAISQQVKALEQELGVELLARANRKFTLTPAGEYFYKKSLVLVANYDRLVHDTLRLSKEDETQLRIGYLKDYSGDAIQSAVARFSEKHPDVPVHIIRGSHEDLYEVLRSGQADIVMNDQRRAFSDKYVNYSLARVECGVEIAARNPISALDSISPEELDNTPCILVASEGQRATEQEYYWDIFGFRGDYLFAESTEDARLMVIQNNGFMPVDLDTPMPSGNTTARIPLRRGKQPITRHYCAFWKTDNPSPYAEEFAELLKAEFSKEN